MWKDNRCLHSRLFRRGSSLTVQRDGARCSCLPERGYSIELHIHLPFRGLFSVAVLLYVLWDTHLVPPAMATSFYEQYG